MAARIIDAFVRAFGIWVFAVILLWVRHGAFPKNILALVVLFFICVPFGALYGWLAGPQVSAEGQSRRRVPGLVLIAIGVVVAIVCDEVFMSKVNAFFYGA